MATGGDLWSEFPLDPREKGHAGLRASDDDRERVTAELTSAFADGRLRRDELDERMGAVSDARTLGELVPLVVDLVPPRPPVTRTPRSRTVVPPEQLQAWAVQRWVEQRRGAVFSLLSVTVVSTGVYLALGIPWLFVVNVLVLLHLLRVVTGRDLIIRDELRRLEKKQARRQRWPKSLS